MSKKRSIFRSFPNVNYQTLAARDSIIKYHSLNAYLHTTIEYKFIIFITLVVKGINHHKISCIQFYSNPCNSPFIRICRCCHTYFDLFYLPYLLFYPWSFVFPFLAFPRTNYPVNIILDIKNVDAIINDI